MRGHSPVALDPAVEPRDVTLSQHDAPRLDRGVQEKVASCPS